MTRVRDGSLARVGDEERVAEGAPPVSEAEPTAAEAEAAGVALPAGASGADVPSWVRAQLRCPDCGGELRDVEAALQRSEERRVGKECSARWWRAQDKRKREAGGRRRGRRRRG